MQYNLNAISRFLTEHDHLSGDLHIASNFLASYWVLHTRRCTFVCFWTSVLQRPPTVNSPVLVRFFYYPVACYQFLVSCLGWQKDLLPSEFIFDFSFNILYTQYCGHCLIFWDLCYYIVYPKPVNSYLFGKIFDVVCNLLQQIKSILGLNIDKLVAKSWFASDYRCYTYSSSMVNKKVNPRRITGNMIWSVKNGHCHGFVAIWKYWVYESSLEIVVPRWFSYFQLIKGGYKYPVFTIRRQCQSMLNIILVLWRRDSLTWPW